MSWLNHLESAVARSEPDALSERAALALTVCSSGSRHPGTPAFRGAALRAALAAVRRRPAAAAELFHCIVYRLRAETEPALVLALLRALPELAASKVNRIGSYSAG